MDPISILINIVIGLVLTAASTLAQQALSKKAQDGPKVSGFRGSVQTGGTVPLSFIVGTLGVAGKFEYPGNYGLVDNTPNAFNVDVLSFGDLPITAFGQLYVNSESVTIAVSGHVDQGFTIEDEPYNGHLWIERFDGTQSTANAFLLDKFGSEPDRPWLSDMIGRGLPYVTLTALIDEKTWAGFPNYVIGVAGIRLYDPREDDTAGGSGDQRWADPSTWAFSDNNVVIIYNILRGIHDNTLTVTTLGRHLWGGRARAYQLPYAEWAAAMDACDEDVDLDAGGTEKRFRAGREIFVDERPADVITELLIGCNARMAPGADGQFHILVGVPASGDGTFTDADTIVTEAATLECFPNLDGIINGATATYMEPAQAWELKETAPYLRSDLEEEDDNRRQLEGLELNTTFSGTQAQRILKAVVEESRRFRRHVVVLHPAFAIYHVLQVLAWTSAENGYSGKLFLITSKTLDPWGNVILALQEIDPADHDWTTADEQPLTFAPLTPIRPSPMPMQGFAVSPYTFPGEAGEPRRPGILAEWAGSLVDIRAVRIQVREDFGDGNTVFDGEITYDKSEPSPAKAIGGQWTLPATDYEVRGILLPFDGSGLTTDWSTWLGVTTPDVRLTEAELADLLQEFRRFTSFTIAGVRDEIMRIGRVVIEGHGVNRVDKTELRNEIKARVATATADIEAAYTELITVVANDLGAVVSRTESLEASYTGLTSAAAANASALTLLTAAVSIANDAVTAVGAALISVEASLSGDIASLSDDLDGIADDLDATAAALLALTATVTAQGGAITSISDAVIAVEASVDDISAGGHFKIEAAASTLPGMGSYTQISIYGQAIGDTAFYTVGDYWLVKSDGTAFAVRRANQQYFVDDDDNLLALFRSGGDAVNLDVLKDIATGNIAIGGVAADRIVSNSITADQIGVKVLDADEVLIDGTTITDLIAANAATTINSAYDDNVNVTDGTPSSGTGAAVTLLSMSLTPVDGTVVILSSGYIGTDAWGNSDAYGIVRVELLRAGSPVASVDVFYDEDGTDIPRNGAWNLNYRDTSPGTSAVTWLLRAYWTANGGGEWAYSFNNSLVGINYKK